MVGSFAMCMSFCPTYFSITATQEILDEFRPHMCPFDKSLPGVMQIFDFFLPVDLPPHLHDQGFKCGT